MFFLLFWFVICTVILVFGLLEVRQVIIDDQIGELTGLGLSLSKEIAGFEFLDDTELQKFIFTQARISRTRLTIVDTSGKVIYDTEKEAETMELHRYRPEINQALSGEVSSVIRWSDTLKKKMLYVAVPIRQKGEISGICRVSRPLELAISAYPRIRNHILIGTGLFFLLGLCISYFLLRKILGPLDDLSLIVRRVAETGEEVTVRPSLVKLLQPLGADLNKIILKIRELSEAQKSDREVFQSFIDSTEEGWLLVDQDGRIILANRSLRQMFPEIGEGSEFFWQNLRLPVLNELINQARNSDRPVQGQLEKEGRYYTCLVSWLPRRQHYLLKFTDITETQELSRRKKEFVANLAHELKTPLTSINGFLDTLEDEALSPEGKNYLTIIKRNTDRIIRLVEDLARLAEIEEKGPEILREPVDLVALVKAVLEVYRKAAEAKGLKLKLEEEPLPIIMADAFQLEQLLVNLVDNAIRYTEKGEVVVKLQKKEGGVLLTVSDTGIGIPEEHLPRIFERFYVVDKSRSRKTGGTGLGLSIVKHVVQVHKGRIEVKSSPGFGTTFSVWLPASLKDSQTA